MPVSSGSAAVRFDMDPYSCSRGAPLCRRGRHHASVTFTTRPGPRRGDTVQVPGNIIKTTRGTLLALSRSQAQTKARARTSTTTTRRIDRELTTQGMRKRVETAKQGRTRKGTKKKKTIRTRRRQGRKKSAGRATKKPLVMVPRQIGGVLFFWRSEPALSLISVTRRRSGSD